jgi:signal transduction histidine kinase
MWRLFPRRTAAGFGLAVVAIVLVSLATALGARERARAGESVAHSFQVIQSISTVLSTLRDAETGQRGYLLTHDARYLEPFTAGEARVDGEVQALQALVSDDPKQSARLEQLRSIVQTKLSELRATITVARRGELDIAINRVRSNEGKQAMDAARALLAQMEATERTQLQERQERSRQSFRRLLAVVYGGGALLLVLTGLAALLAQRDFKRLRAHEEQQQRILEYQHQLIGMTSHDLRNPLMAISISTESLVRSSELQEAAVRTVERIARASSRAEAVASIMSDYTHARLGSGIPIEPRASNLNEVVERVADETRSADPEAKIEISLGANGNGIFDSSRLAQVLSNLLSNAIKYGDRSRPVAVRTQALEDWLVLEVHNEGPPIPEDAREKLFEPFKRESRERGRGSGLGLGLYIVGEIVHAHGGEVRVTSAEGSGTRFVVELPRRPPSPAPASSERPASVESELPGPVHREAVTQP